ncbi:MAG: primosomal protein N' [Candidatus Portnoybacteria bacterium]|nr:primosomal protein N' [Candidatus Portnoybacteria bacterium]
MELMYILNVIPLIKIPRPNSQVLSYFSISKIGPGFLIKVSVRNRKTDAVVLECRSMDQEKLRLKKYADFEIKPIEKIKTSKRILDENQIKLLTWLSEYYFAPIGLFARIFISKKLPIYKKTSLVLTPTTKGLIFSEFKNLKSIIVEDSESDSYQSWGRKPYYNVKDIAIQLAKIHNAKLILKTDLPSVEDYYNAKNKNYKLEIKETRLPAKQAKHKIQDTSIVDMKNEMRGGNFSPISATLKEKLEKTNKAILFIARRGTSTIVLCRECGYIAKCRSCEVPMVYHEEKPSRRLVCHHCGKDDIAPVLCPNCKSIKIKYLGSGTQKIESEIKRLVPNKKVFRLDGDVAEKPTEQQKIITEFKNSDSAILVGSQMILNKGIKADLIAIVSIDTILNLPDFKSPERVFQSINQLINVTNKQFLVQTYNAESKTIKLAIENNFNTFYNEEIEARKKYNYPPFSEIIKLSYAHKDFVRAKNESTILKEKLKQQIKNSPKIQIFGPSPAFISKEKGTYKWNIIIKSQLTMEERNKILIIVPPTWEIEVNPENTL